MRVPRVLAALVAAILIPQPAGAGGSWLETDRQYYTVGDYVVARGTFGRGSLEGKVSDGPFYAYLSPGDRDWDADLLAEDALYLGPMTITEARGSICCWVAEVEFTVPDVPAGRYWIDYCNEPCTVNGIGDLIGGMIFVGDTEREARLAGRAERLKARVERLRGHLDRAAEEMAAVESQADGLSDLEARVRGLAPQTRSAPEERPVVSNEAAALIAGAVLVFAAALVLRHRGLKRLSRRDQPILREVEGLVTSVESPQDSQERNGAESLASLESSRGSRPLART